MATIPSKLVTPPTPSDTPAENTVVFDAGAGNSMTISECAFLDGVFITSKPKEIELIDNFIAQTGSTWTRELFDATNVRHIRASRLKSPVTMSKILDPLDMGNSQLTSALIAGVPTAPTA